MNIYEELNTVRVLMFIETAPQSNQYHQIMLNEKQFKKISDAMAECFEPSDEELRDGFEALNGTFSDETYPLPDLQQII